MLKSNVIVCVSLMVGSTAALAGGFGDYPGPFADEPSVSRAQVQAELVLAQSRGEVLNSDGGYPYHTASIERSRGEVQAELREAQRLGLVSHNDSAPTSTPEQEAMIAKAGAAASDHPVMAAAKR